MDQAVIGLPREIPQYRLALRAVLSGAAPLFDNPELLAVGRRMLPERALRDPPAEPRLADPAVAQQRDPRCRIPDDVGIFAGGFDNPQPHCSIHGARNGTAPVWKYREALDCPRVPLESAQFCTGIEIPKADRIAVAAGESASAVGQHCY